MRCVPFLVMSALLIGAAPARAQQSPGVMPTVAPPATPAAKKHVARKPVAAKTAETKTAAATSTDAGLTTGTVTPRQAVAKPAAPVIVVPKTVTEPASETFAGIPPGERLRIQAALLWSGDFAGTGGGDDPMLPAIRNYQKRGKGKVTGVLSPAERASLLAAAKAHEDDYGWNVVVDPATGIRLGLPTKLVPQARDAAHGTRWSSAHGEVQVETFRIKLAGRKLAALFEQEKRHPATRRIETSALRDDDFVVTGMQGLKMFSVRARLRDGEVRGFTLLYDQMMEGIVAPVTGAMVSAFTPFPERSAPYAALAKAVEYGTGLVVSAQGHIVTDRRLAEGCQVIVASGLGNADRVADDKENGLALLRVYGPRKLSPLALASDASQANVKRSDLTLVGIPDPKEQDGSHTLTEVKARLADGAAIELRQPVPMAGFSGAAALDAQGRFLGMMEMGPAVLASMESFAPPVRLVGADAIRGFLDAHHVTPAPAPPADARAAIVRVICVRK